MALDTFQINLLREGKAYRDEIGEPDAALDAMLERALAQTHTATATPEADAPARVRTPGTGASNHSKVIEAPTQPQLGYLASLVGKLGWTLGEDIPNPTSKKHASELIDRAKLAVSRGERKVQFENRSQPEFAVTAPVEPRYIRPATEGQKAFLRDLLATREEPTDADYAAIDVEAISFANASEAIEILKARPRKSTKAPEHGIRAGHYAFADAEGTVHFYEVSRTGRIFVQAGPARHPYTGKLNEALLAIQADPKSAAALYGTKIGRCGRCHLELTDEDSRARGLGPICAGKTDW